MVWTEPLALGNEEPLDTNIGYKLITRSLDFLIKYDTKYKQLTIWFQYISGFDYYERKKNKPNSGWILESNLLNIDDEV